MSGTAQAQHVTKIARPTAHDVARLARSFDLAKSEIAVLKLERDDARERLEPWKKLARRWEWLFWSMLVMNVGTWTAIVLLIKGASQ